jgi:tRNA dimethylallyltransferase
MNIGTAKPTPAERREIPHHLIDVVEMDEPFDVKRFVELATKCITEIQRRERIAIVVGGTGLYVRALRRGLFEGPSRNPGLRARLEEKTADELFAELQEVDSLTASRIDRHNKRRLVRALEVFYATGRPIAELQKEWGMTGSGAPAPPTSNDGGTTVSAAICLTRDRDDLYRRIERRIDEQIAAGWVEEVRRLMAQGLERNATAMQAAGYRELVAHAQGTLSLEEAVVLIKTRTRQLAKRQLTWFRREPNLIWMEAKGDELTAQIARRVLEIVEGGKSKQIEDV